MLPCLQWGLVSRDFKTELAASAVGTIDLLSALNGGRALGCSNRHYGEPRNLLCVSHLKRENSSA